MPMPTSVAGLAGLAALLLVALPRTAGEPCTFDDGGAGFTTIAELGVRKFVERATKAHVIANALVPSQQTAGGDLTLLFDTPTKDIDDALEVTAQTTGSTDKPVTDVAAASSVCVPYSPELCFRAAPESGLPLLSRVQ